MRTAPLLALLLLVLASCSARDAEIETRVERRLAPEHAEIDVSVRRQVVTLRGYVRSAAERKRVVASVRDVEGVLSVNDELLVEQPPSLTSASLDAVEAASIASSIEAAGFHDLSVEVRGPVVHVRGPLPPERRAEALRIVSAVAPDKRIVDETTSS